MKNYFLVISMFFSFGVQASKGLEKLMALDGSKWVALSEYSHCQTRLPVTLSLTEQAVFGDRKHFYNLVISNSEGTWGGGEFNIKKSSGIIETINHRGNHKGAWDEYSQKISSRKIVLRADGFSPPRHYSYDVVEINFQNQIMTYKSTYGVKCGFRKIE
jgi:hypothetical protein